MIKTRVANHQSSNKFATKAEDFIGFQNVYSLAQCTPDLFPSLCYLCLTEGIASFPNCCDGSQGAKVLFRNCIVKYEMYPFYSIVVAAPAPVPYLFLIFHLHLPNQLPKVNTKCADLSKSLFHSQNAFKC